nr:unnamed protein product [Callosobruchus chinensis]
MISTATIRRRVLASGLRCRRPLRVPLLTTRHRTARLLWARAHQDWLLPQWRNVLFSDESRFGLIPGTMTGAYYLQNIINVSFNHYLMKSETSSSLWTMMPDPIAPEPFNKALENRNIARLEWPAMSPDINPIEHVWDYVSRAIFNRNNPPRNTQELIVAATEEWDSIPQEMINNLIIGMHRRIDASTRSRGGNTKY